MFSLMGTTKQLKTPLWEKFRPDTLYPKGGYEAGYIANLCFTFFSSRKPYAQTKPEELALVAAWSVVDPGVRGTNGP